MWAKVIAIGVFFVALGFAAAASADDAAIGWVKTVSGEAVVVRGEARTAAALGQPVYQKDRLETGAGGSVGVTFTDNTVISAGPNSVIVFDSYTYDAANFTGGMLTDLLKGTLAVTTGDLPRTSPDAMRVRTPAAILGVRGTRFLVRAGAGKKS
jgi:hypothetical protein